ncbi:MAG: DEAD/DEAH box helicase [Candidatus Odinarchaeota archaeon]
MKTMNPSLVKILNVMGIKRLNTVQKLAEEKGIFNTKDDFAIVSMSRTGKSFTGALMVANEFFELKQKTSAEPPEDEPIAIFICPFHTSARDFYSLLSNYFGWFLKPFIAVGEARKSELGLRISKGNPPNVIIATPEAMQSMLRNESTRTWLTERKILSVVYDDVHSILHEPHRGIVLLETVPFFQTIVKPKPRILVLSAKFDNPERLETLFTGAKLIIDNEEYDPPKINLKNYKTTKEKNDAIISLLGDLAEEGTRSLLFMNTIDSIDKILKKKGSVLGDAIGYDIDQVIKKRLAKVADVLQELDYKGAPHVRNGIGCNHGMMDEEQRWFIEWAFRRRYLRLLMGTQTLAYGVNTPVKHVIMGSPGIDEIFRQSMMARAVWMRRGTGQPGTCTVFTKTITEKEDLVRVFSSPKMPLNKIDTNYFSKYLLGLIGLGLLRNEADREKLKVHTKLFFIWASTTRSIKKLVKTNLVVRNEDETLELSPLGNAAFENNISGDQAIRIVEGIQLVEESGEKPEDFDLLLIMNHAASLEASSAKKKKLSDELRSFLQENVKFSLASAILGTEREAAWRIATKYSMVCYTSTNDISFETKSRKSSKRLFLELRRFSPNFRGFLAQLLDENILGDSEATRSTISHLLQLMDSELCVDIVSTQTTGTEHSLKGLDLAFVDFGQIEKTIDATLASDLSAYQKIQLLELLESVESTTSAFVELMNRSVDDPEAKEVLSTVCSFSKESQIGENLIKALKEEGVLDRNAIEQLGKQFTESVEVLRKKAGAPAAAARVMFSLFTGNLVGAAVAGADLLKPALKKKKKVDTRGIS